MITRIARIGEILPRHFDFLSVGEEFGADAWANDALGEHIAR